jgi:hypothetical protein
MICHRSSCCYFTGVVTTSLVVFLWSNVMFLLILLCTHWPDDRIILSSELIMLIIQLLQIMTFNLLFSLFYSLHFSHVLIFAGIGIWYTHVFSSASQGSHVSSVSFIKGRYFLLVIHVRFQPFKLHSLDSIRNVWILSNFRVIKHPLLLHVFLTRFMWDSSFQMGQITSKVLISCYPGHT